MKKYISIIIGAGLAMTSCAINEIENNDFGNNDKAIYASTETDTKATIGSHENGIYKIYWSEGDKIVIADNAGNNAVYASQDGGSTYAGFLPEDGAEELDFAGGIIAGYPEKDMYINSADPSEPVYFTIPDVQNYKEGSFDDNVMPMISDVSYENNLKFYNAAGVLKLMLSSASEKVIKTITVKTTNEFISGECGYIPESKSCFFDDSMLSEKKVTLSCGDGVKVGSEATPFFIVVPHQKYTALTISVTLTDGTEKSFIMKDGKELDVKRSAVMNIPVSLDDAAAPLTPDVKMSLSGPVTFNNFSVNVKITNAEAYYTNLQTKESFERELVSGSLLESIPYGTKFENNFTFTGRIANFLQVESSDMYLEPGETYILWVVIYDESGEYTEEDIHTLEIQMKSFTPGGSITITAEAKETDYDAIELSVLASVTTGLQFVYCQMLPTAELEGLSDQEITEILIKPGNKSNRYEKPAETFRLQGMRPGMEFTFIGVAIDKSGYYGPLYKARFQTKPLDYNSLEVKIDKDINKVKENGGVINWSVSGGEAVKYRYYLESTSLNSWINTCKEDYTYVQEQLYLQPGYYRYHTTTETSVSLGKESSTEYIFIVVAVDDKDNISYADHWFFTY